MSLPKEYEEFIDRKIREHEEQVERLESVLGKTISYLHRQLGTKPAGLLLQELAERRQQEQSQEDD